MKIEKAIPKANMSNLEGAIDKLNRIARKLGTAETTLIKGREWVKEIQSDINDPRLTETLYIPMIDCEIEGETPMLEGWTFVARIENMGDENLIFSPSGDIPKEYRTAEPKCDHCGLDRKRNNTFIVKNESGIYKQVGSNCLKDFLGLNNSPEKIANMLSYIREFDGIFGGDDEFSDFGNGGCCGEFLIPLKKFLARTVATVAKSGYVSVKKSEENGYTPTAQLVWSDETRKISSEDDRLSVTEKDFTRADEVIAKVLADLNAKAELTDYENNLKIIINYGFVTYRTKGFSASLVPYVAKLEQAVFEKETDKGVFVETIGKRITKELTAVGIINLGEGNWGTRYIVKFKDSDGNNYTWFTTNAPQDEDINKTFTAKFTIKDQNEFKGIKQNIITRAKLTANEPLQTA